MFGFIAAAAGTSNDDHQMEVAPREAEGPAKKKQKSQQESHQNESGSHKERVGNVTTTPAEHPQQLRTLFK